MRRTTRRAGWSSRRQRRRSSAATTSSRTCPRPAGRSSRGRSSRPRSTSRSSSSATSRCRCAPRTSRGRCGASSMPSSATAVGRDRRLPGDHDPQLGRAGPGRAVADSVGDRAEPEAADGASAAEAASRSRRATCAGSTRSAARTSTTPRSSRSTTGPATSSPRRQRRLLPGRPGEPEVRAECVAGAAAPADRPGSRSSTRAPSTPGRCPRAACSSTSRPSSTADRTGRRATPTSSTVARSSSVERSSSPSTSRRSGRSQRVGNEAVADRAEALGIRFHGRPRGVPPGGACRGDRDRRGPAARPHGGVRRDRQRRRRAAAADDPRGPRRGRQDHLPAHRSPSRCRRSAPRPRTSSPTSWPATPIRDRTPSGRTSSSFATGPNGSHRPTAVKTGTANDARDLATYGYLGPPEDPDAPALAVGIWMGNSDHSNPSSSRPATSLTAAAPLWRRASATSPPMPPIADFPIPDGLVAATIAPVAQAAGPWTP